MNNKPLLTPQDQKKAHELGLIAVMEEELSVLEKPKTSVFLYSDFTRVGLPILSTLLDAEFSHVLWEEYVGNRYVGLQVVDDANHQIIYELPPLLAQAPTAIQDPKRESLTAESQHLMHFRDISPTEASAQLLELGSNAVDNYSEQSDYGSPEVARRTMDTINKIFSDHGLAQIPMPVGLENIKIKSSDTESTNLATSKNGNIGYDANDGDDM